MEVNENEQHHSVKLLTELYTKLIIDIQEEISEMKEKSVEDLESLFVDLERQVEDKLNYLASGEVKGAKSLLFSDQDLVQKRCEQIKDEKAAIELENPIESRDYAYYAVSLSWYKTRLDLIARLFETSKSMVTLKNHKN